MVREKSLLFVFLAIGAILVILNATGYLNNANSLSTVIIFSVLAIAVGVVYELGEDVHMSYPYVKVVERQPNTVPLTVTEQAL